MLIIKRNQIKLPMISNLFLIIFLIVSVGAAVETRKLDETTTVPATPDGGSKCTPCGTTYPPPSPPYYPSPPPPPPPSPTYYPSPPPPPKKSPSSKYCPPPPPAAYLYITGPPGNLYPVDENFNGAGRRSFAAVSPILVGLLVSLVALW